MTTRLEIVDLCNEIINEYHNFDHIWAKMAEARESLHNSDEFKATVDILEKMAIAEDPEKFIDEFNRYNSALDSITKDYWGEALETDTKFQKWVSKVNDLLGLLNTLPLNSDPEITKLEIKKMLNGGVKFDLTSCSNEVFVVSITKKCTKDNKIPLVRLPNWKLLAEKYTSIIVLPLENES